MPTIRRMRPFTLRDQLRDYLNSGKVSIAEIERNTHLNRSWLSKFRRGEINNPTVDHLETLYTFRKARNRKN